MSDDHERLGVPYRVSQKITSLRLFSCFSAYILRIRTFTNLLAIHIFIYVPILVQLSQYL